jgi:hypothetical protein
LLLESHHSTVTNIIQYQYLTFFDELPLLWASHLQELPEKFQGVFWFSTDPSPELCINFQAAAFDAATRPGNESRCEEMDRKNPPKIYQNG